MLILSAKRIDFYRSISEYLSVRLTKECTNNTYIHVCKNGRAWYKIKRFPDVCPNDGGTPDSTIG